MREMFWEHMRSKKKEIDDKIMEHAKSNVEIICSNIGVKAASWQCDLCVLKNKCGALKEVKHKNRS